VAHRRRVVTVAGADAHARLALRNADPGDGTPSLPFPGYEASFRVMSVHIRPHRPLTGAALADAGIVMRALRNGHLYTAIDAVASPPSLSFMATNDRGTVHEGDILGAGGPVALRIQSNAPAGFTTNVYEGTRLLSSARDTQDLTIHASADPGVYWTEIVRSGSVSHVPWVRSNPIYVRAPLEAAPAATPPSVMPSLIHSLLDPAAPPARLELSKAGGAIERVDGTDGVRLRVRAILEGGTATNQAVALVFDTPEGIAAYDRAFLHLRADRPMRVSVQLRGGQGASAGDRWTRSIYLDAAWREYTLPFTDFVPAGLPHTASPALADVRSVMVVVDLTNTKPAFSGTISVQSVQLQR
jgi:hypothetical protein